MKGNNVHGLKIKGGWDRFNCDSCAQAKSKIQPYATEAERSAKYVGHIVSADLIDCRATHTDGIKFVSVIVDQYSYFTSTLALKDKDAQSVLNHIKIFQGYLLSEGHKGIRIFRSDRGLEYNNSLLKQYAIDQHIKLELGVPKEPRDNGFAERRIRTLIESAYSSILSSAMLKNYWSLAVDYATHVQNRTGRKQTKFKTPYQLFTGRKLNVSHLIGFGTKCWVHTATNTTPKFVPKAEAGIVVGFSNVSMGYRVLLNNKLQVARNVTIRIDEQPEPHLLQDTIPDTIPLSCPI